MTALVVMGVSGCGKSHVGSLIAHRLGWPFIEGDQHHAEADRALMQAGTPLSDGRRALWLARLGQALAQHPGGAVLSCSALKAPYREQLRAVVAGLHFAWLDLDVAAAQARVAQRPSHFFPVGLVQTQFEALESPLHEPRVLRVDALAPPDTLAEQVERWLMRDHVDASAWLLRP